MNTIDRLSATTSREDSLRNRRSSDSHPTMSEDRTTRATSASSVAHTHGDHEDSHNEDPCSPSDDHTGELDFLELSDDLPTQETLTVAGEIPIYDSDGNAIPFRTLYQGPEHQGQRQLLIFIRHFYCGACQAYVQKLCETITPTAYFSLPTPTTITIIGCGEPRLIPAHATRTHCPFRMYSEPTKKIYKLFGMLRTIARIGKKAEYMEDHFPKLAYKSFKEMVKAGRKDGIAGGPFTLLGGEFLFEDAQPIWCHRMRNVRGHADFKTLARVLEMTLGDGEEDATSAGAESPEEKASEQRSKQRKTPDRKDSRKDSRKDTRKGVDKITSVEDERQRERGLRMVYDGRGGDIPRARLARESRDLEPSS